ncbi:MAG TPA: 5-oxoprolinase subunit PxpB [Candidatus Sulfotelmatobacter sp.]|jgi:KipI family sensor histidine kinase inhibitor|nr:5-oxoprolinase subunit PxpB [Candidatus Sulfotelmatobacter sp.]
MRVLPASDRAFLVTFGAAIGASESRSVRALHEWLRSDPIPGIVDLHPAYASLLVRFDPAAIDSGRLEATLAARAASAPDRPLPAPRSVSIPVRYGGAHGPDLAEVARVAGLSERAAVEMHAEPLYEVAFLGFSPGFPYLLGLPAALALPRKATPRKSVPAGSVAIAGRQAGIYPLATAGGWNVIGRTEIALFDPFREPACLLAPGDRVRFVAVEEAR